jgi:hypothetical protein
MRASWSHPYARPGAHTGLLSAALVIAVMASSCSSPAKKTVAPTTPAAAFTTPVPSGPAAKAPSGPAAKAPAPGASTTVPPVHTVVLPAAPCSLLTAADLADVLPGGIPIPRTGTKSATISTAGCSWRWGVSTLNVEITKFVGGDAFRVSAAVVKNPKPLSGLGTEAIESDNLAANAQIKRVVVLVRVGDAAVEVTAQIVGQVIVGFVEAAAHTVIVHL